MSQSSDLTPADAILIPATDPIQTQSLFYTVAQLREQMSPLGYLTPADQINAAATAAAQATADAAIPYSILGQPLGPVQTDATNKIPLSSLPSAVFGVSHYLGVWNALTNTPLISSGVAPQVTSPVGGYYVVGTSGTVTIDGVSAWNAGDWIIWNGITWNNISGQINPVASVAGLQGVVSTSQLAIALAGSVALSSSGGQLNVRLGTGANTAAAGNDSRITGAAQASNNLSDLASANTARSNLGLTPVAVSTFNTVGGPPQLDSNTYFSRQTIGPNKSAFANVQALQAYPGNNLSDGQVANITSFATDGDNGGGPPRLWVANSQANADGVLIIQPTNWSAAGRWIAQFHGDIYGEWFGIQDGWVDGALTGIDYSANLLAAYAAAVNLSAAGISSYKNINLCGIRVVSLSDVDPDTGFLWDLGTVGLVTNGNLFDFSAYPLFAPAPAFTFKNSVEPLLGGGGLSYPREIGPFCLFGPSAGNKALGTVTGMYVNSTGVNSAYGIKLRGVSAYYWPGYGLEVGSNAFCIDWFGGAITSCGCPFIIQPGSNCGERNSFHGVMMSGNVIGPIGMNQNSDTYLLACSLDYSGTWFNWQAGALYTVGTHFEGNSPTIPFSDIPLTVGSDQSAKVVIEGGVIVCDTALINTGIPYLARVGQTAGPLTASIGGLTIRNPGLFYNLQTASGYLKTGAGLFSTEGCSDQWNGGVIQNPQLKAAPLIFAAGLAPVISGDNLLQDGSFENARLYDPFIQLDSNSTEHVPVVDRLIGTGITLSQSNVYSHGGASSLAVITRQQNCAWGFLVPIRPGKLHNAQLNYLNPGNVQGSATAQMFFVTPQYVPQFGAPTFGLSVLVDAEAVTYNATGNTYAIPAGSITGNTLLVPAGTAVNIGDQVSGASPQVNAFVRSGPFVAQSAGTALQLSSGTQPLVGDTVFAPGITSDRITACPSAFMGSAFNDQLTVQSGMTPSIGQTIFLPPPWAQNAVTAASWAAGKESLTTASPHGVQAGCSFTLSSFGWPLTTITGASWASGQETLTTTAAHGVLVGQSFTLSNFHATSLNSTFVALPGTTGKTLVFALASSPTAGTYGQLNALNTLNGDFIALPGTTGSTLVVSLPADPGNISLGVLNEAANQFASLNGLATVVSVTGNVCILDAYTPYCQTIAGPMSTGAFTLARAQTITTPTTMNVGRYIIGGAPQAVASQAMTGNIWNNVNLFSGAYILPPEGATHVYISVKEGARIGGNVYWDDAVVSAY